MVSPAFSRPLQGARLHRAILIGICLLPAPLAAAETPAEAIPEKRETSLSLRQAIQLALMHSRSLEKAGLDREVQRFDLRVAEDEFIPKLDLISSARHNPVSTVGGYSATTRTGTVTAALTERLPTGARFGLTWDTTAVDSSTALAKTYGSSVFLQLDQPLLRGGGLPANLANLRIARLAEQTNILEFKRIVIGTVTNVILVYRMLQQAQRQVEVSESALARAREQLRINRALVSSGNLAPVEIIQTEADIANQEYNLLTAQSNRDSARFALIKVLDIDRDTQLVSTDPLVLPEFTLDLATCRQLAFANRPDYQQVQQGKAISDLGVVSARNQQLWSLNLSSRYRISGDDVDFTSAVDRSLARANEDWNIGLTLQVPLRDLTRRQSYLRARSRAQKAAIDLTEVTENIEIEVRDALRTIDLTSRRVKVAAVARELSERKLEIERGKLQAGRTTNFAIVTFQNDLVSTRLNEIAAQIAYLNALTLLEQTLGTTLTIWGIRIEDLAQAPGPARAVTTPAKP